MMSSSLKLRGCYAIRRLCLALAILAVSGVTHAEPYLAIRSGQKCMACHINPEGGGMRTTFGRIYGQTVLPGTPSTKPLMQQVSEYLDIGGDLRTSVTASATPGEEDQLGFATERATLYVKGELVPNRLVVYLDQRFAPGNSNREAWLMLKNSKRDKFLLAGSFYLPYGLRMEDDTAFIREATGVSFNNADNGIMLGHDRGPWSTRLSLSNGTNGGGENNTAKQIVARLEHVKMGWRAGSSVSVNDGTDGTSRQMFNLFGGLNFWKTEWLAEIDFVNDTSRDGDTRQLISFFEASREILKGHTLRAAFEFQDPDTSLEEDHRVRTSLIWEYTPIPLLQLRFGTRINDSIPQNPSQNTDTIFAQLHVWF